ncbi:MAG TPA: hypothetical protein VGK67_38395 [Myxococcales bacterium]|jgi:hypothetical protein
MTAAPVLHVLELLEARGCNPRRAGAGHLARCPAHEDQQASLSVGEGEGGRVLLKCHAGCGVEAVCSALGLDKRELFPPREKKMKRQQPMDGAALWAKLAEHDEAGEAYLKSRGLEAAVGLGLVRFNVPRRALADDAERWLDKKSGWRVAVAMRVATGAVRDFQLRAITDLKPAKLSLCGAPRPSGTAFGRPDLAAQGGRVFIAEGMADTLVLCVAGVVGIGAPGVEKLVGLAELVPAGAEAVLCVQNDREGQSAKGFARLARALEKRCVRTLWLTTPAPHKDPADWLKGVGMVEFQAALAGEAVHAQAPAVLEEAADRPEFEVRKGEGHKSVAAAVKALAKQPSTFQRDGRLVTVAAWQAKEDETVRRESGAPIVRDVPAPLLWERLSAAVRWMRFDARKDELVACDPPQTMVSAVLCRGEWPGVRELKGVVTAPVLRPDGSVLDRPGYDASTGLLFAPSGPCEHVPDQPTPAEALAARNALLEVVCDFPFAEVAHRSAWLAALLTPFARPALGEANAPLFLIDGNTRGCGKSRLVDCISLIVTGRSAPRQQFTLNAEELDKRVVAHLQAADSLVLFDNVVGDFGGPVLDKLITAEGWYASRLLGKNDAAASLKMRNNTTWYATANNATLVGDIGRRTIHVRLATPLEHPEERADFRHSDLLAWVRQERPRLLAAALTVLRGWFVAGRPVADLPAFGSFETWSGIVRNALRWVDLPDPWADTKEGLRQADPGDSLHAALIAGLEALDPEGKGLTTGEIKRRLEADMTDARERDRAPRYSAFIDALGSARSLIEDGKVNGNVLGSRLRALKEKRKDGAWIASVHDAHTKLAVWRVLREAGRLAVDAVDAVAPTVQCGKVSEPNSPTCMAADSLRDRAVPATASTASTATANDESTTCVASEPVPPAHVLPAAPVQLPLVPFNPLEGHL